MENPSEYSNSMAKETELPSTGQQQEVAMEQDLEGSELPRCFPRNCQCQPVFRGNQEALAWALDNCATICAFVGTGAFLGTVRMFLEDCFRDLH